MLHRLALRLALVMTLPTGASAQATRESALAVEARLLAPCCWSQTLDVHASPLADELRAEIAGRLEAGERGAAIEDDLAARYGERIRALPRGEDPLRPLGPALALALLATAGALLVMARRWRAAPTLDTSATGRPDRALDARLDAELARLDDGGADG